MKSTLFLIPLLLLLSAGKLKNAVYGTSCGWAGTAPEARILVEKYIKDLDTVHLDKWLVAKKDKIALQAYAYEAYIRLEKDGFQINSSRRKRMNEIKASEDQIQTCRGCIYSTQRLKDIFEDQ